MRQDAREIFYDVLYDEEYQFRKYHHYIFPRQVFRVTSNLITLANIVARGHPEGSVLFFVESEKMVKHLREGIRGAGLPAFFDIHPLSSLSALTIGRPPRKLIIVDGRLKDRDIDILRETANSDTKILHVETN